MTQRRSFPSFGNEKISTVSNDEESNTKKKIGFIVSKVLEFRKDIYLPKSDAFESIERDDLKGAFSVVYFFEGDFNLGVSTEVSVTAQAFQTTIFWL